MSITGMGVVFAGGAGVPALRAALLAGKPLVGTPHAKEGIPVLAVPAAAFAGSPVLAPARRADRFCKMTLLAAMEAWQGCGADPRRTGIILATAFGPHATVFRFVNEMLDFGEAKTSPTVFSQSVHAAASSMIAAAAGLHGPVLSLADLSLPFEEALTLAECWLQRKQCDAVLVGAADELSDVLAHVVRRKWRTATDGIVRPSLAGRPAYVPGEGAVFFRLEREGALQVSVGGGVSSAATGQLLNTGALGGDDAAIVALASPAVPARSYAPLWGSTRIGAAFHLATAALMRRAAQDFPDALPLANGGFPAATGAGYRSGAIQVVSACGARSRVITLQA